MLFIESKLLFTSHLFVLWSFEELILRVFGVFYTEALPSGSQVADAVNAAILRDIVVSPFQSFKYYPTITIPIWMN